VINNNKKAALKSGFILEKLV